MVQIGKACLTADHPILTDEGWLLASQAAAKGYGQLPSEREFSPLCGLQLATGGNILMNTSTTQDLASVFIEAATLGYRFLSSPEPLNGNFPTYAVQKTDPRYGSADQTKPSYSQVTTLHHQRVPKRPIPLSTPETHASPKSIAGSDKTAKGHQGEPITGISAVGAQIAQQKPEECIGDLEAARTGSQEIRPTGNQKSGRAAIQGDGPGGTEESYEAVHWVQDIRDGSTGNTTAARERPGPTLPRLPTSSSVGLNEGLNTQELIKRIMQDDSLLHQEKQSCVQAIWAGKGDGDKGAQGGSDGIAADVLPQRDTIDITNTTCHVTPATGTPTNSASVTQPQSGGSGTPDTYSDILIQTPKGEGVPAHEVRWEPNPHSRDGGDNLQLLEVVPGHHLFRASSLALNLCNMVSTDFRSQFYKTPAIGNSPQTPEPPYLRGNGKTIKRLEFHASRRQTWATDKKEQMATISPGDNATASSHKQKQGRSGTNLGVPSVPQGLNLPETEATPHDDNLCYKNGNLKPITNVTARPLARGLTSKARKRLGRRKRNRRRNQRGRSSDEVPQEFNPAATDKTPGGDAPTPTVSDATSLPPCQHMGTILSLAPAERMTTEGAACFGPKESNPTTTEKTGVVCFGPNTALPGQDPFSWEASITSSLSSQGGNGLTPKLLPPRGTTRTIMRRKRYVVQRQARDIERKEQITNSVMEQLMDSVMTILRDKATATSPSHKQGPPDASLEVPSLFQGTALSANEATLYDHNLLYRNGNSKPKIDPTARPLPCGLTSTARLRLGGRKRNRRRNQRDRPSDEAFKAPNPTTTAKTQGGDEPTPTVSDALPLSPYQHMGTIPSLGPAEGLTTEGAACFGPNTALLGQDPLHWAAHISADALTRTIGSLQKGDTVLAERQGKFFEAQIICVMTFEVPQAIDPTANGATQEPTLSTGLGFTLTRHHHIRNFGRLRLDRQGRWQLAAQEDDIQWKTAADLTRYPTRTRQAHTTPVTRVFNLVLDPPGNVVILTPSHKVYISASLGYHMRCGKDLEDRTEQTVGIPVYTQGDGLQLRGLPEFSRGLIQ